MSPALGRHTGKLLHMPGKYSFTQEARITIVEGLNSIIDKAKVVGPMTMAVEKAIARSNV